jgi:hypothetical protein
MCMSLDTFLIMITAAASWVIIGVTYWAARNQSKDSKNIASVQIIIIYIQQFEGKDMLLERSKLAEQILNKAEHKDIQEPVMDFFETVGLLLRRKILDTEMVWANFAYYAILWEHVCRDYIKEERKLKNNDPTIFADFQYLADEMIKEDMRKRNKKREEIIPTNKDVQEFLNEEKENDGLQEPLYK